jgi:hypothetical protein
LRVLAQAGESELRVRVPSRRAQALALSGLRQVREPRVLASQVQPQEAVLQVQPQVRAEPPQVQVVQPAWSLAAPVELPGRPVVQRRRVIAARKRSHVAAMRRRWRVRSVRRKVRTRR